MKTRTMLTFLIMLSLATVAVAQTKISGTTQCGKPDASHTIEIGDRPNHAFSINKSNCTWTKPLELAGTQNKENVVVGFDEINGNKFRGHGYVVDTMENGDKAYVRFEGSATSKDGVVQSAEGKWRYVGGTGKLKGLKGQGTYKGKGSADGGITYEVEGEYTLPGK